MNTEDIPVGGLIGDGILDDEEDVGLDGCSDEYENGWGGCLDPLGLSYSDYLALGDIFRLILIASLPFFKPS